MSENRELGRPKYENRQLQFKENYLENEERIQLECQTLFAIYTNFSFENSQQVEQDKFKEFLKCYGCSHIYETMYDSDLDKYELSSDQYSKFTSKRDVRFFLNYLHSKLNRSLTSTEILMFAACYIKKIKLMSIKLIDCFRKVLDSQTFSKIVLQGPINCSHPIICMFNKIAHWMLSLLKLEGIKLRKQKVQQEQNEISLNQFDRLFEDTTSSSPNQR